jgi:Homeodomain-like domain
VIGRALALALRGHRELVLENLALRQQLTAMKRTTRRPHLQARDRLFWIVLTRIWRNWRTAVVLVQPDTVVRWHREWLRRRWTRRSRPRPDGRPRVEDQIRVLVREMATANPLWGAPRIHGELRTLGVDVSERTVSRLLAQHPHPRSQTWRTFLTNHVACTASMDFFTVPTSTGRVLLVLVVLSHHRRRIVHVDITDHQRPRGPLNRWSTRFRTTRRPAGYTEIGTASTAPGFSAASRASASEKSSPRRPVRARIRTSSARSARSDESVSVTSSL